MWGVLASKFYTAEKVGGSAFRPLLHTLPFLVAWFSSCLFFSPTGPRPTLRSECSLIVVQDYNVASLMCALDASIPGRLQSLQEDPDLDPDPTKAVSSPPVATCGSRLVPSVFACGVLHRALSMDTFLKGTDIPNSLGGCRLLSQGLPFVVMERIPTSMEALREVREVRVGIEQHGDVQPAYCSHCV